MLSEKARGALRGLDFRQKKTSVEVYLHTNGAKAGLEFQSQYTDIKVFYK